MKIKYLVLAVLMSGCATGVGLSRSRVDGLIDVSNHVSTLKMATDAATKIGLNTQEWKYAHNRVVISMESVKSCLSDSSCLTLRQRLAELNSDMSLISESRMGAMAVLAGIHKQIPIIESKATAWKLDGEPLVKWKTAISSLMGTLPELRVALTEGGNAKADLRFNAAIEKTRSALVALRILYFSLQAAHE